MTAPMVLYDDATARGFEPFALTRPVGELRAGGALIRARWERVAASRATGFVSAPHLATFAEFDAPPASRAVTLDAGTLLVNARFAPALDAVLDGGATVWRCDGQVVAMRLSAPVDTQRLSDGTLVLDTLASAAGTELRGWWLHDVWDFTRHLADMLRADIPLLGRDAEAPPAHAAVLGAHDALVARGAYVEPYVLFDTTDGAVLVETGARIAAFTRLEGPCIVGAHSRVAGGRIAGSSIGPNTRVHGEVSATIFLGHANKVHDGFVGHSVIGRWANLGAGTITSNLKNSYGDVALWTPSGVRSSGMPRLGSFIGDHVKLGIGSRLTTGCVIGAGANVYGGAITPKYVPPFAWGEQAPFARWELEKFLTVTARVMARRDLTLDDAGRALLRAAWSRSPSSA